MKKADWKKCFRKLYPGKRLLAIHLNGFSHSVIFDTGKKADPVQRDVFSGCMPEAPGKDRAVAFFAGVGHSQYQNNPKEVIFVHPQDR